MTRKELEAMSNKELQKIEDAINDIQMERIMDAMQTGAIKWKNSKTFMEWWRS
jgi:Leu/Phe-tRNA-protein transferase